MRFEGIALALIAILLAITIYLYLPGDITANAVASFSTAAEVVQIDFVTLDVLQATPPVADGGAIALAIPVTYSGSGSKAIMTYRPPGYESGYNWTLIENGQAVNVSLHGENLVWVANLSAGNATLYLTALAPALYVQSTSQTESTYYQQVRVGSETHFTNVSATTNVSPDFQNYMLFEVNGTEEMDKTTAYHFTVNGTVASWYGFSLSAKEFHIRGTTTPPPAPAAGSSGGGGGGGGSGGGGTVPLPRQQENTSGASAQELETPAFLVDSSWVEVALAPDEQTTVNLTIRNMRPHYKNLTLRSTVPYVRLPGTLTLRGASAAVVPVQVGPTELGSWQGRIVISDGEADEQVFFNIQTVDAQEELEGAPFTEQPGSVQRGKGIGISPMLVIFALMFGALVYIYLVFFKAPQQPGPPQ